MKKNISFFFLLLVISIQTILAEGILPDQVDLEIRPLKVKELTQGDVFSAELEIKNVEVNNEIINTLNGKKLFEGLVINNIAVTKENRIEADVFIFNSNLNEHDILKTKEKEIALSLKISNINSFSPKSQELTILNQDKSLPKWLFLILSTFILGIILYLKRKAIKELFVNKNKKIEMARRKKFTELLHNARERKDYEELYTSYKQWASLIAHDEELWLKYKEVLNKYQYKPEWEKYQLEDVQKAFSGFRGSLK